MDLALTLKTMGPCAVLYCDGRIVCGPHSDQLVRRCNEVLEKYPVLGLELSGVTKLDSGGVGCLVRLLTAARKRGKEVVLISPSDCAFSALEVAKLIAVFSHYKSVEEFFKPAKEAASA